MFHINALLYSLVQLESAYGARVPLSLCLPEWSIAAVECSSCPLNKCSVSSIE
jgi:hypothetical protein